MLKKFKYCLPLLIVLLLLSSCSSSQNFKEITSIDDIHGKKIGVQLGSSEDLSLSQVDDVIVEQYNSAYDAIQALIQDKIDCVILNEKTAYSFAKVNESLKILDEPFGKETTGICVAKNNTQMLEKLNTVIEKLQNDGTIEKIMANYLNDSDNIQRYIPRSDLDRSNGTLTVATNAEFEPYEYVENGEYVGIDMDICQVIADELNMELVIEDMQFAAIINAVNSGKADIGCAGMAITEDRLKSINFTIPLYDGASQVIIVHDQYGITTSSLGEKLYDNFIKDDRYVSLITGLLTTLQITIAASFISIIIGLLIAFIRYTHDKLHILYIPDILAKIYLTIIRGTPSVIQLLIIYYVIFASVDVNKVIVAIIAFGLNSGAYTAEVIRSGWNSVDNGQYEAGRSMGFNYFQTMRFFVLPQAFKNIIPTLGNELIVLVKETAICGYIGIFDLTRAGDFIRSRTYEALLPLITVALIYLIIIIILTLIVSAIEKRLNK